MIFTIHITHRYVEGAGLNNEYYEYEEPCDDYIDLDVDDEQVDDDVVSMIFNDYFDDIVFEYCQKGRYWDFRKDFKKQLRQLLDKLNAWDSAVEIYEDELRQKYEEDYNRG